MYVIHFVFCYACDVSLCGKIVSYETRFVELNIDRYSNSGNLRFRD